MIPAKFDYEVAESVEHAIELLGSRKEAKLLAGGHSLLPLMKLRLARPELLVEVEITAVKGAGQGIESIGPDPIDPVDWTPEA